MAAIRLSDLRPDELERQLERRPALILPTGTIEWHSHHLPLGLDGLKADALAATAAERSDAILGPLSWWAAGGVPFPYTLRLPTEMVAELFGEVLIQFARFGFRTIVVLNGHYGLDNTIAVRRAAVVCMQATGAAVFPVAEYELLLDLGASGDHAGVWETSLLWAERPDLVHLDELDPDTPLPGVIGQDPRGVASVALGREGIESVARGIAAIVERGSAHQAADNEKLLTAVDTGLQALHRLAALRAARGKSDAPPVATPAWLEHVRALHAGRYAEAADAAQRKLSDLAA